MDMKKRKGILLAVFIVLCFAFGILLIERVKPSPTAIQVEYGMDLKDVVLVSVSGQEEYLKDDGFVFYMSDSCSSCMEKLELIEKISNLKCVSQINLYCVWEDRIPEEAERNTAIKNLSLNKKYKFSDFFPFYFCCEKGKVSFTTEDYHKIIKKMMEKIGEKNIKTELFDALLKESEKEQSCIIFVTENDMDFDGYEEIKIKNHVFSNVIQIKDYRDDVGLYDKFDLYKLVFDISSYPSVLYYDGDFKVETMESLQ